jgi:hypothetical protein
MSELFKIFLTSAFTILGGVLIFALTQLIQKFLIEPAYEQSKVIGEICFGLIYYANRYTNPGVGRPEDLAATSDTFRRYASQLQGTTHAIRCYNLFEKLRIVPKGVDVEEAVGDLIRISNSIHSGNGRENRQDAENVKRLLTLPGGIGWLTFRWRRRPQEPPQRPA